MRPARTRRAVATLVTAALGALSLTVAAVPAHAAPAAPKTAAANGAPKTTTDEADASAKAVATGQTVSVESATTSTETESANADGTFTLTQNAVPVRKYTAGAWKPLDADLVRNADGSVSPALTTADLTLSGGGSGPLAVMKDTGRALSLALPASLGDLPAPTLSGSSATYTDVLPGVDLVIAADVQGGFSESLVVKNATAAANPALTSLAFATQAKGVTPATDAAGNFTAKDIAGRTVFSAPAPLMWDSATTPSDGTVSARSAVPETDPSGSGDPETSSTLAPGTGAHVAPVKAVYTDGTGPDTTAGTMALTPDASLLKSDSTVYPLYIDPPYAAGGSSQGYTYTSSYNHSTSFWNTKDSQGLRVGYNGWESPYYKANAYVRMSVSSKIYDATIDATQTHFYATETHSASCAAEPVELWTTGAISSATTWDNPPAWKTKVDTETVAHGWSSNCPAASVGWDIHSTMQAIANTPASSVTFGLQASDNGDRDQWKKFDPSTMKMTVTYDHKPAKPTLLTTSPSRNCTGGIMGDGDVTLYAGVNDTDGGTLSATFQVTVDKALLTSKTVSAASGTRAAYTLTKANLHTLLGTTAPTELSWTVTASDGEYTSAPSATCTFTVDPTRSGPPVIKDTADVDCSESAVAYQVGTPATFNLASSDSTTPDHYLYQLNGAAPETSTGSSISVTPSRGTNVLTVTPVSAGGNIGDTSNCFVYAAPAATASDGDLTGDGHPDLTVVGAQAGLPSGYWLAHATYGGQVNTGATDIGAQGTGVNSAGSPADWNGTQAVTGHFANGAGFNDVLDYNPATGSGSVLYGNGDGATLSPTSGNQANVADPVFQDSRTNNFVTSIASGGRLYNTVGGYPLSGFPDLLVVIGGNLLDEGAATTPGAFTGIEGALPLSSVNPTGTGDWTGWTISSALDGNGLPELFARDTSSGALYYYSPDDLANLANSNPATPVQLATSGWTSAAAPILQAADIDGNGTPDLRKVDTSGKVTAYLFNGTALTAQPVQKISSPDHVWPLDDGGTVESTDDGPTSHDPPAASAADTSGSLTLNGSPAGATWNTDGALGHVLALDGTTGSMTTTAVLSMSAPFSLSLWAKSSAVGGVIASQDGTKNSGFLLYPQTDRRWAFCLATADATRSYDCVAGGTAVVGEWAHLIATYDPATKAASLYVDDRLIAQGTHTAVSGFTGNFTLGNDLNNGARADYFSGSVSNVQTWNGTVLNGEQIAAMANVPLPSQLGTLLARDTSGTLWQYHGMGARSVPLAPRFPIGGDWDTYDIITSVSREMSDGTGTLVGRDTTGTLWYYPATGDPSAPFAPRTQVGPGWGQYTSLVGTGDLTADGNADLIARDSTGTLWLYQGTGNPAAPFQNRTSIGTGWGGYTSLVGTGDLTGDGNADIVARDSTGTLWLYQGTGNPAAPFHNRNSVGTDWNTYNAIAATGDVNGDGKPDLVGRATSGDLWLYQGTGNATTPFLTRTYIGPDWQIYDSLI